MDPDPCFNCTLINELGSCDILNGQAIRFEYGNLTVISPSSLSAGQDLSQLCIKVSVGNSTFGYGNENITGLFEAGLPGITDEF